jgi:hypothetical protein
LFVGEVAAGLDGFADLSVEVLDAVGIRYERRLGAAESPDRLRAVFVVWAGEYGATVRDEGHPGANAGRAGRSYTLRFERVLVLGRPCD